MKKHDKDTGSSQVQIIALTDDIVRLTAHVGQHDKDFSSRRSILKKVAQRKRFLNYLKRTDFDTYNKVVSVLNSKKA
jgi:small subunit ribosomal protein S15